MSLRSGSARRAIVRWAWRQFRREWRQQLMILVLLTVAVAAAVAGSIAAVEATPKADGAQGDARALTRLDATDRAHAEDQVSALAARFGPVEVVGHMAVSAPGLVQPIDLRAQDPNGTYGHATLALIDGRYPTSTDEVALSSNVADALGTHLGSAVTLAGVTRTVVGRVENPLELSDEFALTIGGSTPPGTSWTVLLGSDHPIHEPTAGRNDDSVQLESSGTDRAAVIALVSAAVTVMLALVGLIAATGFLVVAHRRQHQLGLVSAIGATEKQVRLVLLANGALAGCASAVVGGALGVGAWLMLAPLVEHAADHRVDRFDLPWLLLAFCLGLAIVAAVAAAWWPARTTARLPVTAALSRRPPRPAPVRRSLVLALGVMVVGVGAIAAADPSTPDNRPALLIAGLLAVVLGTVLFSPTAIRALAAPARRLPLATRLAVRDLARHQSRASAALAAITLALAVSISIAVIAQASAQEGKANLSDHQLLVLVADAASGPSPVAPDPTPALDPNAIDPVAAALDHATVYSLQVALSSDSNASVSAALAVDHGFEESAPAYVATPELLARYGIDPSSIDPATDLLTNVSGNLMLLDTSTRPDFNAPKTPTQVVELSKYSEAPTALITPAAMRRHGWRASPVGWLVETRDPITSAQLASARHAAATAGLGIDSRHDNSGLFALGRAATIAGALLALAILAMTVGLLRGEATGEMRTLSAVGASGRTRRAIAASAAGALALAGAIISSVGAYVALAAAYRADLSRLSSPPIANLVFIAVGLPLLAALGGWSLGGSDPGSFARQPS